MPDAKRRQPVLPTLIAYVSSAAPNETRCLSRYERCLLHFTRRACEMAHHLTHAFEGWPYLPPAIRPRARRCLFIRCGHRSRTRQGPLLPSRPGEFHPEPRRPCFGKLGEPSKSALSKARWHVLGEPTGKLLDIRSNTSAANHCPDGDLRPRPRSVILTTWVPSPPGPALEPGVPDAARN